MIEVTNMNENKTTADEKDVRRVSWMTKAPPSTLQTGANTANFAVLAIPLPEPGA
jgi:hypothetical protein